MFIKEKGIFIKIPFTKEILQCIIYMIFFNFGGER